MQRVQLIVLVALLTVSCCRNAPNDARLVIDPKAPDRSALVGQKGLDLARRAPLTFLIACLNQYREQVVDYRCRFRKQERIRGEWRHEQEMLVAFREHPFSVDMRWVKNPGRARRVSYVQGKWAQNGVEYMHVELNGILGVLVPAGVKRPIDGQQAMENSRRPISRFGFANTLNAVIDSCSDGDCTLKFVDETNWEGRAAILFERNCPGGNHQLSATEEAGGSHTESRLALYLDREWLVPTGSLSYAAGGLQLGRYVTTEVAFNVGLTDAAFE